MKSIHLIAVLVAAATIVIVATDASAYYHPGIGRFMSRDPIGTAYAPPARIGIAGLAINGGFAKRDSVSAQSMHIGTAGLGVGGGFIPRDPSRQYIDGTNLYQYVHSNPIRYKDPTGLYAGVVAKLTYYPGPLGTNIGHEWLSWPHDSMGFWPNQGWVVLRPDPLDNDNSVPVCWQWDTKLKQGFGLLQPKIKWGISKGKECRCANERDVLMCLMSVPDPGWRSFPIFNNCRRFVNWALNGCCLKKDKKTELPCPNNGSGSSNSGGSQS